MKKRRRKTVVQNKSHNCTKGPYRRPATSRALAPYRHRDRSTCFATGPKKRPRRRLVVVASVIALGALTAVISQSLVRAPPATPIAARSRIASDVGGSVREWVLFLADESDWLSTPAMARLASRAHPSSTVRVVYNTEQMRAAFDTELTRVGGHPIIWQKWEAPVPGWPRDLFVAGETALGRPLIYLHNPLHYLTMSKRNEALGRALPSLLSSLPNVELEPTRARLEGGSLVADDDNVFVTPRAARVAVRLGEAKSEEDRRQYLTQLYGRPVVALDLPDDDDLALGHADLIVAPTGRRRALVGDPRMGAKMLAPMSGEHRARFTAEIHASATWLPADHPVRRLDQPDVVEQFARRSAQASLVAAFDAVAAQLQRQGYSVVRIPYAEVPMQGAFGQAHVMSWANAVQEKRDGQDYVYLPKYSLGPLDDFAEAAWKDAGYEVIWIEALGAGLMGGGLRCLSQQFRDPVP